jgi:ParB family transcriptional regulator, chromosome partitioning protein
VSERVRTRGAWGQRGPTNPGAGDARWLRFLVACGYTLAEIERQIVDAAEQPTAGPSSGAT